MVVDYIRIRKSNLKQIQNLLKKRSEPHWALIALILAAVAVVALAGMVILL